MNKLIFFLFTIPHLVLANTLCPSILSALTDGDGVLRKAAHAIGPTKKRVNLSADDIYVLRVERIASQYSWLSHRKALDFARVAEQEMGFTQEEVIQMLKHRKFMFYATIFSKNNARKTAKKYSRNWTESAINTAPGLVLLKTLLDADNLDSNSLILNNMDNYIKYIAFHFRTNLISLGFLGGLLLTLGVIL